MSEVQVSVEIITPSDAERYLELNHQNRNIRTQVVQRYARDMKDGKWQLTGEAIQFDVAGNLLNGQHRLVACVLAGEPFQTVVARGLPAESMVSIDTGSRRNLSDILRLRGHVSVSALAGAVNASLRWDRRLVFSKWVPTHQEAVAWLDANPEITFWVSRWVDLSRPPLFLRRSVLVPFAYRAQMGTDEETVSEFMYRLNAQDFRGTEDPVRALRRVLENLANRSHVNTPWHVQLALLLKSWNAWLLGSAMPECRWRASGTAAEPFPALVGFDNKIVIPAIRRGESALDRGEYVTDVVGDADAAQAA